jgi:predicted esterase
VFDLEDLRLQTSALGEFLQAARREYGLENKKVIAVGYSNGANIASSLMLSDPGQLAGAVLFRPMVPFRPDTLPNLGGVPVFVGAGRRDPIVPVENVSELIRMFTESGADATVHWHPGGHELSQGDLDAAQQFLQKQQAETAVAAARK